jgi:hypothetical protein
MGQWLMLTVGHKITIGTAVYASSDSSRLLDLQMEAALDVPVNVCRVVLGVPAGLSVAPEDPVEVALGYEDNLTLVFTGTVGSVNWGLDAVRIQAVGSFRWLLAARFNLFYEKPKAGDIVADVVGRSGLSAGKVENGLEFPTYAIGENQTAYDHLRHLARACGFDLYADPADKVVFAGYGPAETHEFQYSRDILSLSLSDQIPLLAGMEVYGSSPVSHGQGADAYSWLAKKEVRGSAGTTSGITLRVSDPALKDLDSAGAVAQSVFETTSRSRSGSLRALGSAEARLGDAIRISDMPDGSLNGRFKITGIKHRLNKVQGYTTTIYWTEP